MTSVAAGMRRPTPTSSSCASTWSTARTSPARSRAGARPSSSPAARKWEGGGFEGSEEERRRILDEAAALGAEYVDVEAAAGFAADFIARAPRPGHRLSSHVFGAPPADLREPLRGHARDRRRSHEARDSGDDARRDAAALRAWALATTVADEPDAATSSSRWGNQGVATRVLSARLRQPLDVCRRWRRARSDAPRLASCAISGSGASPPTRRSTRVVGNPIIHSRSPVMHNAGFAALGLNAVYVPLEARDADDFVAFATPHGRARREHHRAVQDQPDAARGRDRCRSRARVGAINTVTVRDGRWLGANTDVEGFLVPLARRIALEGDAGHRARLGRRGARGGGRARQPQGRR